VDLVAAALQLFDDPQQVPVGAAAVRHAIGEVEDAQGE
jgi:hypothetical protein